MSVTQYRTQEINKLIESILLQFGITNISEKKQIRKDLETQLNAAYPLLKYESSNKASASKFRNDVRSFMIDTIAHLLTLRDMENAIQDLEAQSRDIINYGDGEIARIEENFSTRMATGSVVFESFEEQIFTGNHIGTYIKDGHLRLNKQNSETSAIFKEAKIMIEPSESIANNIRVLEDGNITKIMNSGLGSDLYWMVLSSKREASMEYTSEQGLPEYLKGIVVTVELTTEQPITPDLITAKFASPSRIYRVFAKSDISDDWTALSSIDNIMVEDKTPGHYSLIDNIEHGITATAYSIFKIVMHMPRFTIETAGRKYYKFGLYNIKIKESSTIRHGYFTSHSYSPKDLRIFKTNLEAKERMSGSSTSLYTVNFNIGTLQQKVPVLPKNNLIVKTWIDLISPHEDTPRRYALLPFPISPEAIADPTQIILTDASGQEYSNPVGAGVIELGYYMNSAVVGGTDSSIVNSTTFSRIHLTYPTIVETPYLFYKGSDLFSTFYHENNLHTLNNTWTSKGDIPTLIRCTPDLYLFMEQRPGGMLTLSGMKFF